MKAFALQLTSRNTIWSVAAAILLCAGCVSTPLPDLQLALPARYQQLPSSNATATSNGEVHDRWWQALSDPRLDALESEALATNLDIAQTSARLRAARALYNHADAELLPNAHFRTTDPIDPDASASYLVVGFDSVWELGLFGRSTAVHRLARGALDTAKADVRDAQLSVAAEVARQWILLRAAQQRDMALTRVRDLRFEQATLTSVRLHLQLASAQQVAQARISVAQSESALAEPREAATTASQALAVLLGRSEPDPAWLQSGTVPSIGVAGIASVPADLLRARPDVAREQAAVLRAAGELGIAKADMYPSIAIGASIVSSYSEAERVNKRPGQIGSIGPIIDIPLFDWGMRRAQKEAKGEALQAASLAYRKSVLTAVAEVETALAAVEQQRLREQAALQAWQASNDNAQATATRHRLKLASGIDLAASNADREQAVVDLAVVRATRAIDYVALCKALGGGPSVSPASTSPTSAPSANAVGGAR